MKFKPKGRKIYRQKSRFERFRAFRSNTGAFVTTVLLVGVLGFVGYSAAGPILRFLQDRQVVPKPGAVLEMTEAVASPSPTEDAQIDAVTEAPADAPTEASQPPVPTKIEQPELRGYQIPPSVLETETALEEALAIVPAGTTHILVPLKLRGGGICYATSLDDVRNTKAVQAVLPLERIYEIVKAKGAEPVAVINTLEDQIYPSVYQDTAYRIADSEERWSDPSGNMWMSPFSELTVDYLSHVTKEIADAGFTSILCDGLVFPDFSEEDLKRLDPRCAEQDRYTALVHLVEVMQDAAPGADFYLRVSGIDALTNRMDAVTAADQLTLEALLITINTATAGNAELLRSLSSVHPCILSWDGVDVPTEEKSYIIVSADEKKPRSDAAQAAS